MAYTLDILEEANLEIVEAFVYYERANAGLGEKFLKHLEDYLDRIATNPEHFPQKNKAFREAFLRRFPFLVVYEIVDEVVIVYSVFNTWQNPNKKRR